jgi:hypothetical protein
MTAIHPTPARPVVTATLILWMAAGCSSTSAGRVIHGGASQNAPQPSPAISLAFQSIPPDAQPREQPVVAPAAHFQPIVQEALPPPPAQPSLPRSPEEISNESYGLPVTLASVLELMDRENPTVSLARARVVEAYAQLDQARVLWLPSIRGGMNYNKHDGRLQDVEGNNLEISRSALYSGLGANAVGASSQARHVRCSDAPGLQGRARA